MKLPRKNKTGPIAGKPKRQAAEIVRLVWQGYSQSQIAAIYDPRGSEADFPRKVRRIMRAIESASIGGSDARRIYEAGINTGADELLHIYSPDYSAHVAYPDLARYTPPELLTKEELFHALNESTRVAVEAMMKLCPEGEKPDSGNINPDQTNRNREQTRGDDDGDKSNAG